MGFLVMRSPLAPNRRFDVQKPSRDRKDLIFFFSPSSVPHDYKNCYISNSRQWHSLLLQRMTITIPQVRPAVLSSETYTLLNGLQGFRHFFRHAYGATIEYEQLKSNLDKALNALPQLESDLNQFLAQLESGKEESEETSG